MVNATNAGNVGIGDDNINGVDALNVASSSFESITFTYKSFLVLDTGGDTVTLEYTRPSAELNRIEMYGNSSSTYYNFDQPPLGGTLGNVYIQEDTTANDSDTLDFSSFTSDLTVDLTGGVATTDSDGQLSLTLASNAGDTGIENVITGSGDDTITGNSRDNTLNSGDGNDTLSGGDGNDTLEGGAGNDALYGGPGIDTLDGGDGDNTLDYGQAPQFVGGTTSFTVDEDSSPTCIDLYADFQDEGTPDQNLQFEWVDQDGDDLFSSVDISNGTLTLSYAPDAFGQSDITIRVTNAEGVSTEQNYSITVNPVNDAPTTTGLSNIEVAQGSPTFGVPVWPAFNDAEDGQNLTFNYSVNDTAGIIDEIGVNEGLLSITPSSIHHGATEITITGTDTGGASVQTGFDFTVDAPPTNHAPVLDYLPQFYGSVPAAITGQSSGGMILVDLNNSGGSLTATFTVDASDQDAGDALAFALVSGPATVEQTDATHANVTFSVDESDVQTTVPITVRVTDDGNPALSDEETYLVNVIDSSIDPYGPPALGDGGAKFVYTVPIDGVLQTYANGLPAALPAGYYEPGSPDGRGNQVIISSYTEPSHGTLDLNVDDGTFTYTANDGYYGDDAFTFQVSDGVGISNVATVTLKRDGVIANDDEATLGDRGTPIEIPVLQNDHAGGGGPLKIVSVSPTDQGGEVWIAPGGQSLFYLPPRNIDQFEWDDDFELGAESSPSGDGPEDVEGPGGITRFEDRFGYTVENDNGETASAFVQVKSTQDPKWDLAHHPDYLERQQVGVDGKPGYKLYIRMQVGLNPLAARKNGITEEWTKNTETSKMVVKIGNQWQAAQQPARVLIDHHRQQFGGKIGVTINDKLDAVLPNGASDAAYIVQDVDKNVGFNAAGKSLAHLPSIAEQQKPGKGPSPQDIAIVDQMQGPTLQTSTHYLYVNKKLLNQLINNGSIQQATLDAIKQDVSAKGFHYDQLPDVFEWYKVDNLDEWTYP